MFAFRATFLCVTTKRSLVQCCRKLSSLSDITINKLNKEIAAGGVVPSFRVSRLLGPRPAIIWSGGGSTVLSHWQLHRLARSTSLLVSSALGGGGQGAQRCVGLLCPPGPENVVGQWGIWMSGHIAVPLSPSHPVSLQQYFLEDAGCSLLLCAESLLEQAALTGHPNIVPIPDILTNLPANTESEESADDLPSSQWYSGANAFILYTSGTTSKPKGVLWSFQQLRSQISSLHGAWQYHSKDVLLHALPLNHVHGLVNSVEAGLAAGAQLIMLQHFSPEVVWSHLLGESCVGGRRPTVFMGVPTMYAKLIQHYDSQLGKDSRRQDYIRGILSSEMRLMISGSAALPTPLFERWEQISGHRLLERYGMTEIGMCLSNPYSPPSSRIPGTVGVPLPGAEVRLTAADGGPLVTIRGPRNTNKLDHDRLSAEASVAKNLFTQEQAPTAKDKVKVSFEGDLDKHSEIVGDLQVRGGGVFQQYWKRPQQTAEDFTPDGWFKTGDTASYSGGVCRILGRSSVDMIKSGGHRVSALQLEAALLQHPHLQDIAVIGLPDLTWGERIVAVLSLKPDCSLSLPQLREFGQASLPSSHLPTAVYILPQIPRNAMGKVNKKELAKLILSKESGEQC